MRFVSNRPSEILPGAFAFWRSPMKASKAERMKLKSDAELKAIAKSGSLSSAAAEYEINRRRTSASKEKSA